MLKGLKRSAPVASRSVSCSQIFSRGTERPIEDVVMFGGSGRAMPGRRAWRLDLRRADRDSRRRRGVLGWCCGDDHSCHCTSCTAHITHTHTHWCLCASKTVHHHSLLGDGDVTDNGNDGDGGQRHVQQGRRGWVAIDGGHKGRRASMRAERARGRCSARLNRGGARAVMAAVM